VIGAARITPTRDIDVDPVQIWTHLDGLGDLEDFAYAVGTYTFDKGGVSNRGELTAKRYLRQARW
jgi:hypothetical protein